MMKPDDDRCRLDENEPAALPVLEDDLSSDVLLTPELAAIVWLMIDQFSQRAHDHLLSDLAMAMLECAHQSADPKLIMDQWLISLCDRIAWQDYTLRMPLQMADDDETDDWRLPE